MPALFGAALQTADDTVLTRQGAQTAARHELAKPGYAQAQPPWWQRPLRWILREIGHLWHTAAGYTGGSAALSVLLLGAVVVLGLVIWRVGPMSRSARSRQELSLLGSPETTADDHRKAAASFAAQGQWAQAVRERLRAISRDLEARALVDRRPGRTATELAVEGGRALPDCAAMLGEAAARFGAIWYGDAQASEADYRRLTEIDRAVRDARPVKTSTLAAP